jgi:opacity protein-like surface antigen
MKPVLKGFLFLLASLLAFLSIPVMAATASTTSTAATATTSAQTREGETNSDGTTTTNLLSSSEPEKAKAASLQVFHENHPEVIVAGGIAGAHTRDSHMQVTATEQDMLAQTNSYQWNTGIAQLGMGYVFYWADGPRISDELRWFPTFEPMLNLYYADYDISGDVYRFNNIFLDDVRYRTRVKNTRLLFDVALAIVSKGRYSFNLLLGVGEGWSTLNYRDKIGSATRIRLNEERENNVVWEWGGGLNYAFSNCFNVSLQYIFTDLGRMHLANTGETNGIVAPTLTGAGFQVTTQAIMLGVHVALK